MRTVLYDRHQALGAKMAAFAGWDMPISYKGILAEHQAVRQAAGLFDVSHMGRIDVQGPDAERFLDYLSTNQIIDKANGSVTYTVLCREDGSSVDDVLIYRLGSQDFFVIVNASNRQKDLDHLRQHAHAFNVHLQDRFNNQSILALQGPASSLILESMIAEVNQLHPMQVMSFEDEGQEVIISKTGYTGSPGFEIYVTNDLAGKWWDWLLKAGKLPGLEPAGLGARDTLRLEMGFALYGHELSDHIAPNESVSAWTVKWQKSDFLGKNALKKLEQSGKKRYAYGIKLLDKGIAREGYPVFLGEEAIGVVTSGSFSPSLNQAIALILVNHPLTIGDEVSVQIRQQQCHAQVEKLPFIRRQT